MLSNASILADVAVFMAWLLALVLAYHAIAFITIGVLIVFEPEPESEFLGGVLILLVLLSLPALLDLCDVLSAVRERWPNVYAKADGWLREHSRLERDPDA